MSAGTIAADQPGAFGLGGVHHPAGEAQIHRLRFADRPRQPLGAADARDGAERDLRLAEFRGVGGDDDVAHHRQFAAAAERVAGDRGDGRLAAGGDAVAADRGEIAALNMSMKPFGCISLMSAPAANAFSLPVSRMQPIASSASRSSIAAAISPKHAERQRVEHFRTVETDDADRALAFDDDVFEAAHGSPRLPMSAGNLPAGGIGFKGRAVASSRRRRDPRRSIRR